MFRLAHISDVHLGPLPALSLMELASKRITGFVNWHRNRRRHLFANTLDLLMSDLQRRDPDHLAVTGDLVNLAAAVEMGVNPDSTYYVSAPFTYKVHPAGNCDDGSWWCVHTYANDYYGWSSIRSATIRSDNSVYAQLTLDVTPERVAEVARRMGVRSPLDVRGAYVPAIGLGSVAVSPLDLASAYATLAAGGVYAYYLSFIDPRNMFDIVYSVFVVLAVLLGGRGTIWGPVLGAFILEPLNQVTNNDFDKWFGDGIWDANVRLIFFGAMLMAVVLFLPRGIIPSVQEIATRRRESKTAAEVGARFERKPLTVVERGAREAKEAPAGPLLELKGVEKRFGGVRAVDGVSLSVERGSITALIGPNGSGKTTLFNLIDGTMPLDKGEIWFEGERIDKLAPYRRAHRGIGRTFQITRLFRQMTVLENVVAPLRSFSWRNLGADAVSGPEAERAHELLEFVGMHRFAAHRAGALSYGQGKLVELAQILMLDPKLIMLDEPAGGINPTLIAHMEEMIRELNRQGTTFLIVEHNMPLVLGLCDPVCVLARGRTICTGPPETVQTDPAVLDAYLGEDFALEQKAGVS